MGKLRLILFLISLLLCFESFSQTLSIKASGDNAVSKDGTFHVLPNTVMKFDLELSAPNDSITKIDSFTYSYDGKSSDVSSTVNNGKLSINQITVNSGSTSGSKKFAASLRYFTGAFVSDKWKDDAESHSTEASMNVRVWDKPDYSLSGKISQTVKGVAEGIKWTVSPKGGYTDGWKAEWSYGDTKLEGLSFTLPKYENTTTSDQTLKVKLVITNYAPDNATVWYTETREFTVVVEKAPAVESHADISGYSGFSVKVSLSVQNATSGWSVKWSFNGKNYQTNGNSFTLDLPTISSDEETYDLSIEVLNSNSNLVVNSKQTLKTHVYSKGTVSFDSSVDSTKVNSGASMSFSVKTKGGMPSGWKFIWKDNGTKVETTDSPSVSLTSINNSQSSARHIFSVEVSNSIDGVFGVSSREYYFDPVLIFPSASAPTLVYMRDETRGCISNSYCIREGNYFSLWTDGYCSGGYYSDNSDPVWSKNWVGPKYSQEEDPYYVKVTISTDSKAQTVEKSAFNAHFKNYGPNGLIWNDIIAPCNMKIYKRPQTPSNLSIKGNGTSKTMIASMPSLSGNELSSLDYYLVFGYEDDYGVDHDSSPIKQDDGLARFDFLSSNMQNSRVYVYALWNYSDAKVTSGKRYLDSNVNEDWDGSVFGSDSGTRSVVGWDGTTGIDCIDTSSTESISIYNIFGQKIENVENLSSGIYIKESIVNGQRTCTKFIVK